MAKSFDDSTIGASTGSKSGYSPAEIAKARKRLSRFAWLLDSVMRIPGTRIRLGLEPMLGVVPVVGDVAGKIISLYVVWEAWRLGLPPSMLMRMFGNILIDLGIGVVPVAGDIADVFWRANKRNVDMLNKHLDSVHGPVEPDLRDVTPKR